MNEYMELLAKETTTLHKVLSRHLSVAVVEVGFARFSLGKLVGAF